MKINLKRRQRKNGIVWQTQNSGDKQQDWESDAVKEG